MKQRLRTAIFTTLICGAAATIPAVLYDGPFLGAPPAANPASERKCGACTLLIEPEAGMAPLFQAIAGASTSIDLSIYELDDPTVEAALAAAHDHGIAVRVTLSRGYEGAPSKANQSAYAFLAAHAVPVRWAPSYFPYSHEKSLVVDGTHALIMSFNLVEKYYPTSRDFGIFDNDTQDVAAMEKVFEEDWHTTGSVNAPSGNDLIWSPGAREAILGIIGNARNTLEVYNEEMEDPEIVAALENAAERGVAVRIIMTYSSEWKKAFADLSFHNIEIRTFSGGTSAPLYIHAKMIVADGAIGFVGSENFSATSLDLNRELGVTIESRDVIAALGRTFDRDWNTARPFL